MKCSGKNCPMQYPYDVKACAILKICPHATLIPYTNADRLSAMSDEEKAKEITMLFYQVAQKTNAKHYILDWLQQPAEEDS